MLRTNLRLCALAVFGAAAVAVAQPPAPPAAPADTGTSYRAKQVIGSKVSIAGNVSIGTVDDIVFGEDGMIDYLIVLNEGKLATVPWPAAKFDFKAQTAVVNITEDKFRILPTYTVQELPNFYAPAYRTEVYRVYGLTPREIRREIRRDIRK